MIIKGESKNRGHWKLAIVEKLHSGKDNVIRAVELRAAKSYLEQPIQPLYPMELQIGRFRLKRTTAAVAKAKIRDIQQEDDGL